MRRKVVAGNWKMFNNLSETVELLSGIKNGMEKSADVEMIVCPPFTSLETASTLLKSTVIGLGAQNMYYEPKGAFTGEISTSMLLSAGCKYVIIGHSERRTIFGESDELINKKIMSALEAGLKPIFCFGETLEQREGGETKNVVEHQIRNGLAGITKEHVSTIIAAYEPVWAIGTGKTATPEQAQEVHAFIRELLSNIYDPETAQSLPILYGGSVKPGNAAELFSQRDIDGGLIGGACLKADSFLDIYNAARAL